MSNLGSFIWRCIGLCTLCVLLACGDDAKNAASDAGNAGEGDDDDLGPTESSVHVRTRAGVVHGKLTGATRAFLGIPYAAPPTGELRFRSPKPAEAWSGELDASAFGPACMQAGVADASEDCLSVNVWAPDVELTAKARKKARPTMVWLHGGAFVLGSNALFDGAALAERGDVVVVAVNYRLGALGFLAHPALSEDPKGRGSSGNYGIEDQTLALQWVKENVRAFGGDPENVTLFGESAGSACTCVLLGTPGAQGLVDHAIMESGACLGFESSLANAEALGETSVASIGCDGDDTLTCLREKSAMQIVNATNDTLGALLHQRWRPILDGVVVPEIEDIEPIEVPVLIGTNRNEGGAFGLLAPTESVFASRVADYFPDPEDGQRVLARYNAKTYGSWAAAFSAMVTDSMFVCPTRRLARAAAAEGVDTYLYSFVHGQAFHADEVQYVFGSPGLSADQQQVSDAMMGAWTRFARTGDPNGGQLPTWPKYDEAGDQHMIFDVTPSVGSGLERDECDFVDTLPPLRF